MTTHTGTDLNAAAGYLRQGELVALPTETVYGLAGNAFDEQAVLKIFKLKNRPTFDPLIVHVASVDFAGEIAQAFPESARLLMNRFWPGPLTILLKKKPVVPDLVTSGLDTVAVRMPSHPLALALLSMVEFPLAAPSANPFGYISPTTPEHVLKHFSGLIPYVIDGGPCRVGIESTIVGFEDDTCVVYRLGGTRVEDIRAITGEVKLTVRHTSIPSAPGMLASHYAPEKPLYVGDPFELLKEFDGNRCAVIVLNKNGRIFSHGVDVFELSADGNLDEAARNLFKTMREIDHMPVQIIIAEKLPEKGLGKAINDRLQRASIK